MNNMGSKYLNVLRSAQVLREPLHDVRSAPGQTHNRDQPEQSGRGSLPTRTLAGQSAGQSEAQKAQQECQIFYVGEDSDFSANPADESELSEQRQRAREKQCREIPALGCLTAQARFN